MSDNIVPLRPRDQVPRRTEGLATTPIDERLPVFLSNRTDVIRLLRGLASVGLTIRLDVRSNCVVIEDRCGDTL